MNFVKFCLDQWRTALFYFVSIALTLTVFRLAIGFSLLHIPASDVLYSALLAVVCFFFYLSTEYSVRRPFYRETQIRLQPDSPLHAADTFTEAHTMEQRLFLDLLQHYYRAYANELTALEERRQFFEVFTLRFAHQLKTPVTVLQLLKQELDSELLSGPVSEESLRSKLDTIAEECLQLNQSLNTMIYTARLEAFEFDAHMEKIELLALVREVINAHKSEWIRRSIFPKVLCELVDVWIQSDRKWLSFLLDQVVRNALQYGAQQDQQSHTFEIVIHQDKQATTIDFIDEGIGIPKTDLRRVFDPFFTGENGRSHSRSTGMGLYLVREVSERIGHSVSIQSEENVGTTVTLVIPQPTFHSPAFSSSSASS